MLDVDNNEKDWIYSDTTQAYTEEEMMEFIDSKHRLNTHNQERYLITKEDKNIGIIDLYDFNPNTQEAWIGIAIHEKFRRQGLGKNGLNDFALYCKENLLISTLLAKVQLHNTKSITLFEGCGYKRKHAIKSLNNVGTTIDDIYVYQKQLI